MTGACVTVKALEAGETGKQVSLLDVVKQAAAGSAKAKAEDEDNVVMETKLKIIEIFQVNLDLASLNV